MSKETAVIDKETAKAIKNIGERTLTGHIVTEHDYPEDFQDENGNYENICITCGAHFIGNKGRVTCKACIKGCNDRLGSGMVY